MVELDELLSPVTDDDPCGPNLEYAEAFLELEKLAAGTPARQDLQTGSELPAELPHWPSLRDKATDISTRTKDLRVAVRLTEALARTDGVHGVCTGLRYIHGLLDRYWATVHPQPDPEDGDDPSMRLNILAALTEPMQLPRSVRLMSLTSQSGDEGVALRDVEVAAGRIPAPEGVEFPHAGAIESMFLHADINDLARNERALGASIEALDGINTAIDEKAGPEYAVDFSPLSQALRQAHQIVKEWLERRRPVLDEVGAVTPDGLASHAGSGEIRNRDDIVRALDRICDYLYRTEPANPVPLLLERAKRLMSKTFVEIIQDLAPEIMPQIDKLRGVETNES